MKPYKVLSPSVTIDKIRLCLSQIGLFVKEETHSCNDNLYTTRLMLSCNSNRLEKLNIGTNGKGITYQYALASGYAEFMERLQNNLLFRGFKNATLQNINSMDNNSYYRKRLIDNDLVLDFLYDPREKELIVEEAISDNFEFYKNLFPFLNDKKEAVSFFKNTLSFDYFICVPFYSHRIKKEVYLPIDVIGVACGSNGMASGNTKEEALIQGFCEIFERYSGYEIYRNNLTPPNVPLSDFKGHPVYEMATKLIEDNNYKLLVKDCSLGLGLPTLGVLVIDEDTGKYNFNLGAALDPNVALERCLTELYQGFNGLAWYDIKFEQYSGNPDYTEEYIYINGSKLFTDSSGAWPISLFSQISSYDYKGLISGLNISDSEDLNFIKNKISELGFEIFVRDVSFLGFNSYCIVVPGMSQYPIKKSHYEMFSESYGMLHSIRNIEKTPIEQIKLMCDAVNKDYINMKHCKFDFNELIVHHINKDLLDLDIQLLFFMLNYKVSNLKFAYFYLNDYLSNKDFYSYRYYYGIRDFVKLKLKNYQDQEIVYELIMLYGNEIYEICEDLKEPDKILQYYDWPSCFNCENCGINNDCCQFEILHIIKNVQHKQKEAVVDYNKFVL